MEGKTMTNFNPAQIKPVISFDLFQQIDIRLGTIELAEEVPKSDKLLRLTVDFGDHKRTILAGMKQERADWKQIIGKQTLFVVNLEPRKMMGEISEGMLFDTGFADGLQPAMLLPEAPLPNGTRAG